VRFEPGRFNGKGSKSTHRTSLHNAEVYLHCRQQGETIGTFEFVLVRQRPSNPAKVAPRRWNFLAPTRKIAATCRFECRPLKKEPAKSSTRSFSSAAGSFRITNSWIFPPRAGIAIREVRLKEGRCDYLFLIDRKPVGIIEAKKAGVTLSIVADQSGRYAENLPDFLRGNLSGTLPFLYESTGTETFFRDERDPHPRSRPVFAFHRPETLAKWLEEPDTLRHRLAQMPFAHPYDGENVRVCRVEAITNLEQSFAEAQPRALIQMATGAGKALTACAFTYRLIKHARLYLLGVQLPSLPRFLTSTLTFLFESPASARCNSSPASASRAPSR
jgi:hypothetical protein